MYMNTDLTTTLGYTAKQVGLGLWVTLCGLRYAGYVAWLGIGGLLKGWMLGLGGP